MKRMIYGIDFFLALLFLGVRVLFKLSGGGSETGDDQAPGKQR